MTVLARQSSINVAVRVRPFTQSEENKLVRTPDGMLFGDGALHGSDTVPQPHGIRKIVNVVDDKMLIFDPPETSPLVLMQRSAFPNGRARVRDYRFVFDRLFDEDATQSHVYHNTTQPLLDSVLDGYNATVFAYGATGCGKTHTILGNPDDPGVIFLTMQELYARIELLSDTRVFDVSILFLEIYNETIRDLLNPDTPAKKLVLREDSNRRISVSNLSSHKPPTVNDVMELILVGNRNRTSSPTEANAASSRSHAVLQINVTLHDRTASLNEEHTFATLSIIDLAGSERAAATKNRGARLNEGANINKSLLALGNCINALCDPRRRNHVPYRNSKLTRLLKFSLGGNCKTVMIVCISPLSQHYDETLNTLKYADRAKEIKTKLIRNQHNLDRHVGSYLKMITEQKQEIEELRSRETRAIEAGIEKHTQRNAACLKAITDSMTTLRLTIDKQTHDKWRKYFLLAKRKLLILQLNDINTILAHVQETSSHYDLLPHHTKQFVVLAEQLRNKMNEQIINLETQYEAPSEIDQIFGRSMDHTLMKLKEMEGWTESHTEMFHAMFDSVRDYLQKDLLTSSSVLFDYLIGELNPYDYLPLAFSQFVLASGSAAGSLDTRNRLSQIVAYATDVLERMSNSEYDAAIEDATSQFMLRKTQKEQPPLQRSVAREGRTLEKLTRTLEYRPKDKRGSTSPLRNSPPTKRTSRFVASWDPSQTPSVDANVSIDESSFVSKSDFEDDSPIADHVNKSILDPEELDPVLNSPPPIPRKKSAHLKEVNNPLLKPKLATDIQLLKHPLLNKEASTKIVHPARDAQAPPPPVYEPLQAGTREAPTDF